MQAYAHDARLWVQSLQDIIAHYQTNPVIKERWLHTVKVNEVRRDFINGSLRQINNLIQFDDQPNYEIKEAQSEIYKISISFQSSSKIYISLGAYFINVGTI